MQTPLCKSCSLGDNLCQDCAKKLSDGALTSFDIEVSKILYKINEGYNISEASFCDAVDFGDVAVIFTEGEVGFLIGKKGKVVSALSSALGKRVRIVKKSQDPKSSIADLLHPATIIGMNHVFSPEGQKVRMRIDKRWKGRLYMPDNIICQLSSKWLKAPVEIVYE